MPTQFHPPQEQLIQEHRHDPLHSILRRFDRCVAGAAEIGSPGGSFTAPLVLPAVALTSPANKVLVHVPGFVFAEATAAKAGGFIARVEFYLDGVLAHTSPEEPYQAHVFITTAGPRTLSAVAVDNLGLRVTNSVSLVANHKPMAAINFVGSVASFPAPATVPLEAIVSDSDGSVVQVRFYAGDTLLSTHTEPPYQFNWTGVPPGSYFVTVQAGDNQGGVMTSIPLHVIVGPVGIIAPVRTETGEFQFQFVGTIVGKVHLIQVSTGLVNWTTIATITHDSNSANFTDPNAGGTAGRYYRIVQQNAE